MIPVTKPLLPDMAEFQAHLADIWESHILTNHGPKVQALEASLRDFLEVPDFNLVANGTLALQIALRSLNLTGKIVTTPFSYVATTASAVWEGFEPVFADIKRDDFNIDPSQVEDMLRKDKSISAILATHVYGLPCDLNALEEIGRRARIPVIYDAAHAFSVKVDGKPILSFGDVSVLSFHATKVFHTVEGGGIFSPSPEVMEKIRRLRNFGHVTPESFAGLGTNAKMSEMHASMGLCILDLVEKAILQRKRVTEVYDGILFKRTDEISRPRTMINCTSNYAYFPILLASEKQLLAVKERLHVQGVTTRRYFYPSLNTLPYVNTTSCPVAEDVCTRVLCLPLYPDLKTEDAEMIAQEVYRSVCG